MAADLQDAYEARPHAPAPLRVLNLGLSARVADTLARRLGVPVHPYRMGETAPVLKDADVLLLGGDASILEWQAALEALAREVERMPSVIALSADPAVRAALRSARPRAELFVASDGLGAESLAALCLAIRDRARPMEAAGPAGLPALLAAARDEQETLERAQESAGARVTATWRSWSYDGHTGTLHPAEAAEPARPAEAGLVSFAVRTGAAVSSERAADDPRFDPALDDPAGYGSPHVLVLPLAIGRRVLGALAATRASDLPPFTAADTEAVEEVRALAAAALARWASEADLERSSRPAGAGALYRREALARPSGAVGPESLPAPEPAWTRHAGALLGAAALAAVAFATFARVHEYASGPAVVRLGGRIDVTARLAGTVAEVRVAPGQTVGAGDVLVRVDDDPEAPSLERLQSEHDLWLRRRLAAPDDPDSAPPLMAARARLEEASARRQERLVRAPAAGRVAGITTAPGARCVPGQALVSLAGTDGEGRLLVLLPGRWAPLLRPGQPLRLELDGEPHVFHWTTIDRVATEVVGAAEARQVLGPRLADAVSAQGPVVLVSATLPEKLRHGNGGSLTAHDGLMGRAHVRVRSEPAAFAVAPWLKTLRRLASG